MTCSAELWQSCSGASRGAGFVVLVAVTQVGPLVVADAASAWGDGRIRHQPQVHACVMQAGWWADTCPCLCLYGYGVAAGITTGSCLRARRMEATSQPLCVDVLLLWSGLSCQVRCSDKPIKVAGVSAGNR